MFNLCWSKNEKYKKIILKLKKKIVFTVWVRFRKFIRIIYVREAYAPLNATYIYINIGNNNKYKKEEKKLWFTVTGQCSFSVFWEWGRGIFNWENWQ